jgi:hypothetical protein
MKRFYAENFALIFDALNLYEHGIEENSAWPRLWWNKDKLTKFDLEHVRVILKFEKVCTELNLKTSAALIGDIRYWHEKGTMGHQGFKDLCIHLHRRLQHELEGSFLLWMNTSEVKNYLLNENLLELDIAAKFSPELLEDLSEASACITFQRWTAVVFHLMRVMERAVKLFAARHNVTFPDDSDWGRILADIKPAIEAMPKGTEAERTLKNQHSEIFSLLYHVKQAWRHDTMHPRQTYTEKQSKEVFAAVLSYLTHLSGLL